MSGRDSAQYGSENGQAKLTETRVAVMRATYRRKGRGVRNAPGRSVAQLATRYGVTYYAAWRAIHRQTWPHVREIEMTKSNDVHGACGYCTRQVDGLGAQVEDEVFQVSCAERLEDVRVIQERDEATVALDL